MTVSTQHVRTLLQNLARYDPVLKAWLQTAANGRPPRATHHVHTGDDEGSILDSGSSRHISRHCVVQDKNDRTSVTGFNNSSTTTTGSGYVPITAYDEHSGTYASFDIKNADHMANVSRNINGAHDPRTRCSQ